MKRFCAITLVIVGLTVLPCNSSTGDKKSDKDVKKQASIWMRSKTKLSQEILLGLTEGDFDKIKVNAGALNLVHFLEAIVPKKSDDYLQQMALFSTANKELIRQAEAKNIYGATLAFNQLTVSCVQCHIVVRKANR